MDDIGKLPGALIHPTAGSLTPDPAEPQFAHEGLRIRLEPIPYLTKKGLLPTPNGIALQCPPLEQFHVVYGHSHQDYDTLKRQQSRAGVPQLATIQFDTLVLDYAPWTVNLNAPSVGKTRTLLRALCLSGTPFRLLCVHPYAHDLHTPPEWDGFVTLRQFTATEKAGEGDARYFNVSFVEYHEPTQARKGKGRPARGQKATKVKLYWDGGAVDADGNRLGNPPLVPITLSLLAKHFYHAPSLAHKLGDANKLGNWGATDPLIKHPRWKHLRRGKFAVIKIPTKNTLLGIVEFSGTSSGQGVGQATGHG
jgi:hypothetical protein